MGTVLNFTRIQDEERKNGGSVTRKRGSKKLYVDFYYQRHRIVKSTGLHDSPENVKKAEDWLSRVKEKIDQGTFVFAEAFPGASIEEKALFAKYEGWQYKPCPDDVLFADYVEEWKKRFLDGCQSISKKRDQSQIIDYWLLPYFKDKTFQQITGVSVKEFVAGLSKKSGKRAGERLSASRVRNILIPFRTIWYDAVEENQWALSDPFVYLKKHKLIPRRRHRIKQRYDVFRYDEWIAVVEKMDPYYRPVAGVMIMTGMIGSEIAGLRKADLLKDKIRICNSIVREHEKKELKTEFRDRELPITAALRERLDKAVSRAKGEYVFTMKSGRTFDVDSFRKNVWTTALKKAGIPYRVPYTTRHSFAAWALTCGMDPNRLASLMGHGSKEMVYEVYGKYVEGLETDAGEIREYLGKDFMGMGQIYPSTFAKKSW